MLQLMTAGYGCIKISVLCFYRRLFNVRHGALFDRATQAFIALVIVWTAGFYFACAFVCGTHFDKYWGNVLAEAQYCPHGLEIYEGLLISNLITDVLILSIPVPIVGLQRLSHRTDTARHRDDNFGRFGNFMRPSVAN